MTPARAAVDRAAGTATCSGVVYAVRELPWLRGVWRVRAPDDGIVGAILRDRIMTADPPAWESAEPQRVVLRAIAAAWFADGAATGATRAGETEA